MRFALFVCVSLGACAPVPPPQPEAARVTLQDYKRDVARRIVQANADTFAAPLPEVMKSIIVLEITVDDAGRAAASVYRSNGYGHLDARAVASVVKAAPFAPPAGTILGGAPSVTFLETFLFRDDELFQVRSLVGDEKLF